MPLTDHKDLTVVLTGDQFFIPTNSEYSANLSEPNGHQPSYQVLFNKHTHAAFSLAIQVTIDAHTSVVILWGYWLNGQRLSLKKSCTYGDLGERPAEDTQAHPYLYCKCIHQSCRRPFQTPIQP
jgi:hypothetical protein